MRQRSEPPFGDDEVAANTLVDQKTDKVGLLRSPSTSLQSERAENPTFLQSFNGIDEAKTRADEEEVISGTDGSPSLPPEDSNAGDIDTSPSL